MNAEMLAASDELLTWYDIGREENINMRIYISYHCLSIYISLYDHLDIMSMYEHLHIAVWDRLPDKVLLER